MATFEEGWFSRAIHCDIAAVEQNYWLQSRKITTEIIYPVHLYGMFYDPQKKIPASYLFRLFMLLRLLYMC